MGESYTYNQSILRTIKCLLFLLLTAANIIFARTVMAENTPLVVTPLGLSAVKDAQFVGTETCAACHEEQFKEFRFSTHSRLDISDDTENTANGCETCHGPGSVHADNGGGKGNIINPNKSPEICFTCHMDKKMEFRLPFHHPVTEGFMSCSDCHDLHGPEARPWTATSLDGINEACFNCHQDIRGPFVWEHGALRDGCTTCHKVHGSINDKMLIARDNNLCLRCHIQSDFPEIGDRNHGTNLTQGTCWSGGCHNVPHGSNFDKHFRF